MAIEVWDQKSTLLINYMPRRKTINAMAYSQTLQRLCHAIKNKWHGLLSSGIVLLHNNIRLHAAALRKNLLKQCKWEVFEHLPYSLDFAASKYHIFSKSKDFSGGNHYGRDKKLKKAISAKFKNLTASEYAEIMEGLMKHYDKSFNLNGDYAKK